MKNLSRFVSLLVLASILSVMVFSSTSYAWTIPARISGSTVDAHVPGIAVGNNNVIHSVWAEEVYQDGTPVGREVFYTRSTDGGTVWSAPVDISGNLATISGEPVIHVAADQSNEIHVVWEEQNPSEDLNGVEVYYTRSTDGGLTWPVANQRNVSQLTDSSGSPYLFVDATATHNVHVAWTDYGGVSSSFGEIRYAKSADGGASFSGAVVISTVGVDAEQVAIAADSATVQAVWQQDVATGTGDKRLYHSRSTNGGTSFEAPKRLSTTTNFEVEPAIVIDGNARVHVAWEAHYPTGGGDIFWTRSTNAGVSFAVPANRSNNASTTSQTVFIGGAGNKIEMFWMEDTGVGTRQAYTTRTNNGGTSWTAVNSLGTATETITEPFVFVKGTTAHAVWEDGGQIFFTKE